MGLVELCFECGNFAVELIECGLAFIGELGRSVEARLQLGLLFTGLLKSQLVSGRQLLRNLEFTTHGREFGLQSRFAFIGLGLQSVMTGRKLIEVGLPGV